MMASIGRWAAAGILAASMLGSPALAKQPPLEIGDGGGGSSTPIPNNTGGELITVEPTPKPSGFLWMVSGDGLVRFQNTITSAPGSLGGSVIVQKADGGVFQFEGAEYALNSLDPQVDLFSLKVFGLLDGNVVGTTLLKPTALGDYADFGAGDLAGIDIDELRFGLDGFRISFDEDGLPVRNDISQSIRQLKVGFADTSTTVPEPGSWALMIVGFGVVGAAARRRRVGLA